MKRPGRQFIQNPGPTNIPDEVLEAFRRPPLDFNDPAFLALVDQLWDRDLPRLFGGAHEVVVYTSVGHGAWEGALANLLDPGEAALASVTGTFGRVWAEISEGMDIETVRIDSDPRRAADVAAISQALSDDPDRRIKAVCVTHTETSTGTRTDLAAVRKAIDDADHPALLVVDAVASLGTEHTAMTDFGVDVLLGASQKGLMMPPGLGFCGLSEAAFQRSTEVKRHRAYWSWPARADRSFIYWRFGGTPPEQHMYALAAAIGLIDAEGGIDETVRRHARLASGVRAAVAAWGEGGPWEFNAVEESERANGVTCVRATGIDTDALVQVARDELSVSVAPGMTDVTGPSIRIGHMGSLNEPMVLGALGGLETAMLRLGLPFSSGLSAASAALATP